jgi:hypothetical protein
MLAAAFVLLGADCPGPEDLDEDFIIVDDGLVLQPLALPATVSATPDALPFALDAADWWNVTLGALVLEVVDAPTDITVELGLVPATTEDIDSGGEPMGIARLDYDEAGFITACEIVISSDIAYDEATVAQVARHELGHCLALADDPGPPMTVDLASIMSSPLDPLGELTDHDRALLLPFLP